MRTVIDEVGMIYDHWMT